MCSRTSAYQGRGEGISARSKPRQGDVLFNSDWAAPDHGHRMKRQELRHIDVGSDRGSDGDGTKGPRRLCGALSRYVFRHRPRRLDDPLILFISLTYILRIAQRLLRLTTYENWYRWDSSSLMWFEHIMNGMQDEKSPGRSFCIWRILSDTRSFIPPSSSWMHLITTGMKRE